MNKKLLFRRTGKNVCFTVAVICIILTGCKRESPTPPSTPTVIISLVASSDSLPADGVSSLTITTTVKYSAGDSVAEGAEVKFYTTLGTITARDTTNSDGIAIATLVSETTVGSAEITAYCLKNSNSINIPFLPVGEEVYIYSLTAAPSAIPANGVSQSIISAILKYTATGEPANSLIVNFSATLGTIIPHDTTDSNGLATAVLTSSITPGTSTVKVWYGLAKDSVYVVFTGGSGDTIPASVVLYSVTPPTIAVQGSGGNETSSLVFQVKDASGQPVSGIHTVDFTIDGGPGGGEYLYPLSALTETLALTTTHLNSGTISGPVKVVARVQGTSIFSGPVEVTIVGGPPDQAHFSVVTEKVNLYALWYAGVQDIITAYVGDQYGNPVLDSTAVWFSTECGLIQPGSGSTGQGVTSNTLVSCAPWPSNGLFYVRARTIDGNGNTIQDSVRVLWSHDAILELSPLSFSIPDGQSQSFTIRAYDLNGNPLVGGSTIDISTDVGEIHGPTSILIPDTQSPLWTQFYFELWDDESGDTLAPTNGKVTVDLNSENGNATVKAYGNID